MGIRKSNGRTDEKTYVSKEELFESGSILKVYGSNYLFNVSPAFPIDRVCLSIVKLHTNGSDSFDIYLTCEEVRNLCSEIDAGISVKKLTSANDAKGISTAYKWIKGKNGSKYMTLSKGDKGVLVIGGTTSGERKCTVVQYADLQELSFNFKLVAGLVPVAVESYYGLLVSAFNRGQVQRKAMYKNFNYSEHGDFEGSHEVKDSEQEEIQSPNKNSLVEQLLVNTKDILEGEFYIKSPIEPETTSKGHTNYSAIVQKKGSTALEKMIFYYNQISDPEQFKRLVAKATLNTQDSKGIFIKLRYSVSKSLIFRGIVAASKTA